MNVPYIGCGNRHSHGHQVALIFIYMASPEVGKIQGLLAIGSFSTDVY